jgi:hypothetical protein
MNSRQARLQFQIGKVLDQIQLWLIGWFAQRPGEEASTSAHTDGFSKALVKACRY